MSSNSDSIGVLVVLDVISSHFRRCGHNLEVRPLDGLPSPLISPFHLAIVSGSCWSLLPGRNSSQKVGYLKEDPQSLDFYLSFLCLYPVGLGLLGRRTIAIPAVCI